MSVYSELVDDLGVDPDRVHEKFAEKLYADAPAPWNLESADVLDLWGTMNLRTLFGLLSGGSTPTTYTRDMARQVAAMTEPTLLGFDEPVVDADYTRAVQILQDLRSRAHAVEGEVLDVD